MGTVYMKDEFFPGRGGYAPAYAFRVVNQFLILYGQFFKFILMAALLLLYPTIF